MSKDAPSVAGSADGKGLVLTRTLREISFRTPERSSGYAVLGMALASQRDILSRVVWARSFSRGRFEARTIRGNYCTVHTYHTVSSTWHNIFFE